MELALVEPVRVPPRGRGDGARSRGLARDPQRTSDGGTVLVAVAADVFAASATLAGRPRRERTRGSFVLERPRGSLGPRLGRRAQRDRARARLVGRIGLERPGSLRFRGGTALGETRTTGTRDEAGTVGQGSGVCVRGRRSEIGELDHLWLRGGRGGSACFFRCRVCARRAVARDDGHGEGEPEGFEEPRAGANVGVDHVADLQGARAVVDKTCRMPTRETVTPATSGRASSSRSSWWRARSRTNASNNAATCAGSRGKNVAPGVAAK